MMTLYAALASVLGDDALRATELADRVNESGLSQRRDGRPVPAYQVTSTVHGYRDLFDVDKGIITLRPVGAEGTPDEEAVSAEPEEGVGTEPEETLGAGQVAALPGDRITRGIAGEHFVCGELAKRGWIATLTAKNTPDIDVLTHRTDSARPPVPLQIKTRSTAYRRAWRVGREDKLLASGFYVFVDLGDLDEPPSYWIVPAAVARELWSSEQLRTSDIEQYRDRWDLLDSDERE